MFVFANVVAIISDAVVGGFVEKVVKSEIDELVELVVVVIMSVVTSFSVIFRMSFACSVSLVFKTILDPSSG